MKETFEAAGERLIDFDDRVHRLFKPHSEGIWMRPLHLVSKLGDQPQLRLLSAALLFAGIVRRNGRLARAGARMLLAHEAATFAKDLVKTNIDRKRPRSAEQRKHKKPRRGRHTAKELSSFPSGHSAGAAAVAAAFAREYPELGPQAAAGSVAVASLQIPRCAHYPTDVVAGLAIGAVAEKIVDLVWSAAALGPRQPEQS